jgi:hypothetical protein
MVLFGEYYGVNHAGYLLISQLCYPQALWPEGSHQEDHPLRPFDVLSADPTRDEAAPLLQP